MNNVFNLAMLLENAARRVPDKTFLTSGETRLSFGEVAAQARKIAAVLTGLGVRPGEKVALLLPNEPVLPSCYYGVLAAGATVVPLHVTTPGPELAYFLDDSEAVALIAWEGAADAAVDGFEASEQCHHLLLAGAAAGTACPPSARRLEALTAGAAESVETARTRPEDVAAVVYTSGTTGRSKGARLTHHNLYHVANLLTANQYSVGPADVALMVVPASHAFGHFLLNMTCLAMAGLSLLPGFVPQDFLHAVQRDKVTFFAGVPTLAQFLLSSPVVAEYDLSSLSRVLLGGSALAPETAAQLKDRFQVELILGYGMTELPAVALGTVDEHLPAGATGRPTWGTSLRIVDEEGDELPPGEPGEILIYGPALFQGYHNRPEETAASCQDGWFHTGDVGRVDEAGFLFVVDRLKEMIKTGGYSVFPSEVDLVLQAHPAVMEAAVVGVPDASVGELVKAFVVLKPGADATAAKLVQHCRSQLAAYKCPRSVEFRKTLPKSPTGKVQRRALVAEAWQSAEEKSSDILEVLRDAPEEEHLSLLHGYLREQVARLTHTTADEIDVTESIYSLGLESLHVVTLRNHLETDLTLELPLGELLQDPSLAHLASVVKARLEDVDLAASGRDEQEAAPARRTFEPGVLEQMTPQEARRVLTELDTLSNEEVNVLLKIVLQAGD